MNVWQIILVLVCVWIAVLLVMMIRAEKARKKLRHRMDLILVNFTNRAITSMEAQTRLAFRLAANILENVLEKEK